MFIAAPPTPAANWTLQYRTSAPSTLSVSHTTPARPRVMPPSLVQSAAQRVWSNLNSTSFFISAPTTSLTGVANGTLGTGPTAAINMLANDATTHAVAATVETVSSNFPLALALSTLAGASTGLGGLFAVLQRDLSVRKLGIWQGAAAGFMLAVSIFDLGPTVLEDMDVFPALIFFCIGGMVFGLLKQYVPEPEMDALALSKSSGSDPTTTREVLWSGLLTAAGISLHNFPEGVAVCVASLRGLEFGLPLAIAIGLHNIPEGMAVSLPLFFATRNKAYAVRMAFLSGMAEPAGVLFVLALIHLSGELTKASIAAGMSMVAGIMVVLSFIELVPQAVKHAGRQQAIMSTTLGLVTMTVLMRLLDLLGLGV